ncbi:nuclear transport factor 2 family protein [Undibacterium sp. MH2W]|uniref:nuclear transport factor 2 family protein n=1 Tax=Undibacterium sp. MH2W TaxID=3413044 RepID=UPI003BEF842C
MSQRNVDKEVMSVLETYHAVMVGASIDTLDVILDEGFTLTHITGYVQPREEWLDVVRCGDFNYHDIHIDESSLSVDISSISAKVKGRGIFYATINGLKRRWPLQFNIILLKQNEGWKLHSAKYRSG